MTKAEGTDTGYSLIGVVSFGDGCGVPNKYAVSTEFSNYLDWVADQFSPTSRSSTKHRSKINKIMKKYFKKLFKHRSNAQNY